MVISSEKFWNQAHEALSVKELKDYSGTEYKNQQHNQHQNVKANNFLQFATTEKIGSKEFDLVLYIKFQRLKQELHYLKLKQKLKHQLQLQQQQELQQQQQQELQEQLQQVQEKLQEQQLQ